MDLTRVKVVKKDGTKEDFNVQKVISAISKSAERAMIFKGRTEFYLRICRREGSGAGSGADPNSPDAQYCRRRS